MKQHIGSNSGLLVLATFLTVVVILGTNGVGRVAELVREPPYESRQLSVHPADSEVCQSALGPRSGDEWCVVEVRDATRYTGGHWFVDVEHVTTGETKCAGSGVINVKPVESRALIMWLSFYSGQMCRPRLPFVVRTVRVFQEPVKLFGVTLGTASWRVVSPVSAPVG